MVVCPKCGTKVESWKCVECEHEFSSPQPRFCPNCGSKWESWYCEACKSSWLIPSGSTNVSVLRTLGIMLPLPNIVLIHVDELRRHYARPDTSLDTYVKAILHDCNILRWHHACAATEASWGLNAELISMQTLQLIVTEVQRNSTSGLDGIRRLYDLVNHNVRYEPERGQILRFPIETLTLGKGDCEDQAIALAALYTIGGYKSAVVRLWDYTREFHHVCCAVRADKWIQTGLWTLGGNRETDYIWKILDPAFNHPFTELPSWIEHYRDEKGKPWVPSRVGTTRAISWSALSEEVRNDVELISE